MPSLPANAIPYINDLPIIAGNWKMNNGFSSKKEINKLLSLLGNEIKDANIILFPPFTLLEKLIKNLQNTSFQVGAQDCHENDFGAHTGSISAKMIMDLGAVYVILGHSERRMHFNEESSLIKKKMNAAHCNKLVTILCVGEDNKCRTEKKHKEFIINQLNESLSQTSTVDNTIIAYEPIWAIGTGNTAMLEDIQDMHKFIYEYLSTELQFSNGVPKIIYGGSVNPQNSKSIIDLDYVSGVLVGGSSLSISDFSDIILCL